MARKTSQANNARSPAARGQSTGPAAWPLPPKLTSAINNNNSIYSAPDSAYDIKLPDSAIDPPSSALPKDEPLTPKSPDSKSPTSVVTAFTSQTVLARNASITKDVEAVNELLGTMKLTLGALGATFDTLGEQTLKVAELGPAIDANYQISLVRKQLDDQHKRQEQRMQDVKVLLKDEFKGGQLQERLQEVAATIVRDVVKREIAQRVRKQLQEQVTQSMRDQVAQYQRQILEVKASLHNSEARRHNGLIRTSSIEEQLRPLVRPLPPTATPSTPLSGNTVVQSSPSTIDPLAMPTSPPREVAPLPGAAVEGSGTKPFELLPPTPSPLFPRDLPTLMKLGDEEVKTLVSDYGLLTLHLNESGERSREDNLNRFLSYIGVGFQLVTGSTSPAGLETAGTPLVRSRSEAVGVL